jgi:glutamate synthase (ferredoxin)
MTGGQVVILGHTGRNFAAGMSGGIAYVLDTDGTFSERCNKEMCDLEHLTDKAEVREVKEMIHKHAVHTRSTVAQHVLDKWVEMVPLFVKVIPRDFKRMHDTLRQVEDQEGLEGDEAWLEAFRRRVAVEVAT